MRSVFFIIFIISKVFANPSFNCHWKSIDENSKHKRCIFNINNNTQEVDFLYLKGSIENTAYWHARYLGDKIVKGVVPYILEKKEKALNDLDPRLKSFFNSISKCITDRYKRSVSREFIKIHENIYKGLKSSGYNNITLDQIFESTFAIELSILMEGLLKKFSDNKLVAVAEIAETCGLYIPMIISDQIKSLISGFQFFGCTGIAASSSYTQSGDLLHARNFDSSLLGYYEKYPVVIVNDPPNGYKYVGLATAGLHYAGGVTGFNEKGISVSSHELQTEEYRSFHLWRSAEIGPYVQNLILEKAGSIDEAIKIAKSKGHFGAWTIFVSDSKTNEIASIEFTGKSFAVARRVKDGARAQTNHFLAESMLNANYEYSYNKTLESRSRFDYVESMLQAHKGRIDEKWMMNMLAGHTDYYAGLRSFGRTVTKAYTNASHVINASKRSFWMSLGDSYPVSSGNYVGVQIDFGADDEFFDIIGFYKPQVDNYHDLKNWQKSLAEYMNAYIYYRNYSNDVKDLLKSYESLSKAIMLSELDGVFEVPYFFVRGRLSLLIAGKTSNESYLKKALSDFELVLDSGTRIHDYQLALTYMWAARVADLLNLSSLRTVYYDSARKLHEDVIKNDDRSIFVKKLLESYYDSRDGKYKKYDFKPEKIDFITIE